MFEKFREVAYILSYKDNPLHPDLLPEERRIEQRTKTSTFIGRTIQTLVIASVFGWIGAELSPFLFRHIPHLSITTMAGIAGGLAVLLGKWLLQALENFISYKAGNRLSPFFGHKLDETIKAFRRKPPLGATKK